MMMQDMMYRGRSPYMGINSMNRFGMQGQQQAQQPRGMRTADMQDGNFDGVDDRDQNQNIQQRRTTKPTKPNYPMYNQQGTTWQNYRGGMQQPMPYRGWRNEQPMPYRGGLGGMMGGGMYGGGGMMGGYGGYGGGMMGGYGGGMMGGYGGGMMGGLGGMMPPMPRPSPYGGGYASLPRTGCLRHRRGPSRQCIQCGRVISSPLDSDQHDRSMRRVIPVPRARGHKGPHNIYHAFVATRHFIP